MHGLLSNGLLNAINPVKLIEGAVEMPLMAWSRQSEITADRAGLLAVGDEALARRVLLAWSIRSARLLKASEHRGMDEAGRGKRRQDDAFFRNDDLFLDVHHAALAVVKPGGARARTHALEPERAVRTQAVRPTTEAGARFFRCRACARELHPCGLRQMPGRHAGSACRFARQNVLNVRCPQCQNVLTLRPKPAAPPPAPATQK
jgi:hypothetical protein